MVFAFSLPTTSHLQFQSFFQSESHPSLPQRATATRNALRIALKKHKRLSPAQRTAHLAHINEALNEYLPYLFAISRGLSSSQTTLSAGQQRGTHSNLPGDLDIILKTELEVEWQPTLSSRSSLRFLRMGGIGRSNTSSSSRASGSRVKGRGLDFEIAFVLSTLAYVLSSLARVRYLTTLYANTTPSAQQKTAAIQAAVKNLLLANSIHTYVSNLPPTALSSPSNNYVPDATGAEQLFISIPDLNPSIQSALASLAMAEATLLAVLKDDAYVSVSIQARNRFDTEWMVKAPDIPKVRALLFARLCVRAAEYADQAAAGAGAVKKACATDPANMGKLDDTVSNYMHGLARVARAKACRFFAIDAEIAGNLGEGIAWLSAGRASLGVRGSIAGEEAEGSSSDRKTKGKLSGGFARLRREWSDRREERKIEEATSSSKTQSAELETDIDYGDDVGREEEGKVIEMLEKKWVKMNDTINTQSIPPSTSLISNLPSGRDIHSTPASYVPPTLDPEQLERMRGPPDASDNINGESSGEDDDFEGESSYY
ncbi:hypothetical protein FQN57_000367 [Myotisia sp. PD_48]|nr:hypothetical protein FQN57_000367 [Myotisia sp. PD_48]